MKIKEKISIFAFAVGFAIVSSSIAFDEVRAQERIPESFTTYSHYGYRTNNSLGGSPDSMEAWVKLPATSIGGTICGNILGDSSVYGSYNWEIDGIGRIKISWDDTAYIHTFGNADIMDNNWHHVAVVRNHEDEKFTLYIDGTLIESAKSRQRPIYSTDILNIAHNACDSILDGTVKQITVYEGAISSERIREDMQNINISTDDSNARLLGNWYLGEKWTERHIEDTSLNNNGVSLVTFSKYVGLVERNDFDYTFIVLPDIQCCNRYQHSNYMNMMQWIVDSKEELNAQFVMAVGDLSDNGTMEDLYRSSAEGFHLLDNKVPYSFVQGNHDYDDNCSTRSSVYFNRWYPYSFHSKMPGFGGAYEEGTMANTYYLYEVSGIKYCVLNLEFGPRLDVLRWAGRICEKFYDHRIIIETHDYVQIDRNIDGLGGAWAAWRSREESTTNHEMFDYLVSQYQNIFMVFGGHRPVEDIIYVPQVGIYGNKIHSYLVDTQFCKYRQKVGIDNLLMVKMNEKTKIAHFSYYSPSEFACWNIQNQFDLFFGDPNNPTIG